MQQSLPLVTRSWGLILQCINVWCWTKQEIQNAYHKGNLENAIAECLQVRCSSCHPTNNVSAVQWREYCSKKKNTTNLCSASSLSCQHDTAHICCWALCCGTILLSTPAAGMRCQRRQLLIDSSCLQGAQQQNPLVLPLLLLIDGTDRQTDRICSAYYAGSVKKNIYPSQKNYWMEEAWRSTK